MEETTVRVALSRSPPGGLERKVALGVVVISALTLIIVTPFARLPLPRSNAFIPLYQSALIVTDLITAVLLFGQFAQLRTRGLLMLASGYLFDALIIVPHTMSFPGLFSESGLLGSGPQTTAWLYCFWHGGFALFVIAYASVAGRDQPLTEIGWWIAVSVAGVTVLVVALAALCMAGHDWLPVVMVGNDYTLLVIKGISPAICGLTFLALWLLWPRRNTAVLDLWLIVVMSVWLCDVGLSAVVGSSRFDLGFYSGRTFGLVAASFLLVCLLVEMHKLYGKLADALELARHRNEELIASRQKLAEAQRFEGMAQLTGGVAHDFNNLLAIIGGSLDMIARAPADRDKIKRWTSAARTATARGASLTQQLLTFGQRQVSHLETVDVNRLIADFEPLLAGAVPEGIDVRIKLDEQPCAVRVDPRHLETALLNIVVNARDAMPEGGRISIELRGVEVSEVDGDLKPGRYIALRVADQGTGMSQEVLSRAFEPFFTTKEVGRGSGVGLSQVYGFSKSVDGAVRMESHVGKGTTVTLYLPAVAMPPAAEHAQMPRQSEPKRETCILVVEDEVLLLRFAAEELAANGYRVRTATNGPDALKILQQDKDIDVLFSDIVMPGGMNGWELASAARQLRSNLKVLLTSGYAAPATGVAQDIEVLGKPYRPEDLAAKLWQLIQD